MQKLFDRPIFTTARELTLVQQVYTIVREEIHSGHWQVGDRLPSISVLADQTQISTWPIKKAFEMLRKDGYVRQDGRAGTFLISINPKGSGTIGTLGIAMLLGEGTGHWKTEQFTQGRLARILDSAAERKYLTEVKYIKEDADWKDLDRIGCVFGKEVKGIISLHPFPHQDYFDLPEDRIPFVYWGSNSSECLPLVAGDTHNGFYRLTKQMIEKGHEHIVCLYNPRESERENANRRLGHEKAMKEAGLTPNYEAGEQSLRINPGDLRALREFIESYNETTAIICMRGMLSQDVVAVCEVLGLRIPEDISVVSHGSFPVLMSQHDTARKFTRLDYDQRQIINASLDLLDQQAKTRQSTVARILIRPSIIEGDSLAKPRTEQYLFTHSSSTQEQK